MSYAKGVARLRDTASGEEFVIWANELDWQCIGESERGMGPEYQYEATVERATKSGRAVLCSWLVVEYPVGAENYKDSRPGEGVEILDDFVLGIDPVVDD